MPPRGGWRRKCLRSRRTPRSCCGRTTSTPITSAPPAAPFKRPERVYQFDNGPRHTLGFEPDTFVDVTDEWPQAVAWLGKLMALARNQPYDASTLDGAQRAKEALALYRGQTCGVRYAEAVRGLSAYPRELF
jgi:hypothetical protein